MKHNLAEALYQQSALRHSHLCPRQVLGVRMGLLAAQYFDFPLPQTDKRLLTIVETDGCFADGVAVATGCELGRRTLRLEDYGKVAATFIDTQTDCAIRIKPHPNSRIHAQEFCTQIESRWHKYLTAYQQLPDDMLFMVFHVQPAFSLTELISSPDLRICCDHCHEEIVNGREVVRDGQTLCLACADGAYYYEAETKQSTP